MRREIHVAGLLPDTELEAVATAGAVCPVGRTLASGVSVQERVELLAPITGAGLVPPHNPAVAAREGGWAAAPMGSLVQDAFAPAPLTHWPVSAVHLDGNRALVDLGHQSLVIGRPTAWKQSATTPMDLMLGALAACTAIFIGRWAGLRAFPIESVLVRVRATSTLDSDGQPTPITALEKVTELHANLGEDQFEVLDFAAGNCVLGETFKRGTDLVDNIVVHRQALPRPLDTARLLQTIGDADAFAQDNHRATGQPAAVIAT
jgi:uncharacterized OsmC-like protein